MVEEKRETCLDMVEEKRETCLDNTHNSIREKRNVPEQ
jgi:hypothetical protein